MSENPETVVAANETTTKNGEENFNDEIKDYAKTTMNELLGMFGYDEEITRESVDSLEIKVPSSSEESSNVSGTTTVNVLPSSSVAMVTAQTTSDVTTTPVTVTPSLPLTVPEDSEDDTPVIVKVEGNTSVNDIIRQQNAGSKTSNSTGTTSTVSSAQETPATQTTSPAIVTTQASQSLTVPTTQSENGQPALAPHFYAVPPAVRGLYCVVANLPLVVNQSKSAMTFKFWNCITCSEYFLQKPEVVFRVHYPHLFSGQPEWLYQAAVCDKCHHALITTVAPLSGAVPESLAKATFKVIDCKMEDHEGNGASNSLATEVVVKAEDDKENTLSISTQSVVAKEVLLESQSGDKNEPVGEKTATKSESVPELDICEDTESTEENTPDNQESYKCYVCSISVSVASRQGKLRRSKFPSLFIDVPGNVGHFKVCYLCFDRLNRQRDRYIQASVPEEERNYIAHMKIWNGANAASKSCSSYSPNVCFICEAGLDGKDPSRPIFRSRYPTLFRGLPDHVIHLPICDLCYKKLQKVKLRFDSSQQEEESRNYVQFVNMWRAKRGLGQHPVLI